MKARAALLTEIGKPLVLSDIELPDTLEYGQIMVRILASGICGAQLAEIDGRKKGGPRPHPLGHEGVGIVEEIGMGVSHVVPGDKVVLHWRCGAGLESDYPSYQLGDKRITGGKIATFASHAVVSENRCTLIDPDVPDEFATLLGCSLSTALGTIENEADLKLGETVLIVGCGGLGLNLILAAKLRGASKIVVVDIHESKREIAMSMGATDFSTDIGSVCWPTKFNVGIDTSGNSGAIEVAIHRLAPSGKFVMIGQPQSGVLLSGPIHLFEGEGKTIIATQGGRFNPTKDIPRYVAAWRAGHLNIDGIVTHEFPLEQINDAIDLVRAGQAGRIIIRP